MNRLLTSFLILCTLFSLRSQVHYGSVATYGLRKMITTYTGNAILVRRSCDNATVNIGFTSCGDLDTATLKIFVLVPNPLSAISTTAVAAYSLRKLLCSYSGNAIRIRSTAAGSPTTDIGFTANGDLDTATMKTFVGANSAFVTIWYDQSGNGRNASQGTNNNQPRIMNAGVIEYQNNRPALRFQDISDGLQTANFTAYGTASLFNGVARVNANLAGAYNTFVSKTGSGGNNNFPGPFDFYYNVGGGSMNHITGAGTTASFFNPSQSFNAAKPLGIWSFNVALSANTASFNGTSILAGGAATNYGDAGQPLNIGKRNDGVTGLNGWIQEIITWGGTVPSATDIKYVEWTQGQYYSISGAPSLGTLPSGVQSASVATWYDQSSSGAHASPTVTTNAPLIMSAGIVQRNSTTIPAIKFNGAQKGLVANRPVSAYPITLSAMVSNSAVSTNGAFVKLGGVDNVNNTTSGVAIGIGNSGGNFDNSGNSLLGVKEWNVWCPSSPNVTYPTTPFATEYVQLASGTCSAYLNGVNVPLSNPTATVGASITGSLYVGGYRNATDRFPSVKETEIVVFSSALNDTRRVLMNSNQAAYHNITLTGTRYTPPSANNYHRFVLGIGRVSATDSVNSTRESAGMGFTCTASAGTFLQDNGDYLCAGMSCPTRSTTTANVSTPIQLRWLNDWYIDKTDVGTAGGNVTIYFDFSDYGYTSLTPGAAAGYSLLNRPNTASNFTVIPVAASVSGDRVYFTVSTTSLTDLTYYTIGSNYPPTSPLPVELMDFTAITCERDVCLSWSTASEVNGDHFAIERSGDAENWTDIKHVKAAGDSKVKRSYETMDYEPLPGVSYYRLKMVDKDETFKYSKIESVEFKDGLEVGIYPNPSSGTFNLSNCKNYDGVVVTDLLGRKVYSENVSKNAMVLDLNILEAGSYFITLNNSVSGQKFTSKVIIDKK